MHYEYSKHNFVSVGVGLDWRIVSFYLSVVGGVYFQLILGTCFIEWVHHGKYMRKELDNVHTLQTQE